MMKNLILPSDIYAVKEIGIKKWQKDFFWPISDQEYFCLLDEIWEKFDELYKNVDGIQKDLILSDTNFIGLIAQYLHACAVKEYCRQKEVNLFIGGTSKVFYEPDWRELSAAYKWQISIIEYGKFQMRRLLKRIYFNKHLSIWRNIIGLFSKPKTWSLGSFSHIKEDYVKAHQIYCDHPYSQTLLPFNITASRPAEFNQFESALDCYLKQLQSYCHDNFGFKFSPMVIQQCWVKRLECLFGIYRSVSEMKYLPETLLLTEVASPLHKAVTLSARTRRTKIIGFYHGEIGNLWNKGSSYNEYSHCDYFVCPTAKSAEFHTKKHNLTEISRLRQTIFVSGEASYYKTIKENCKFDPVPTKLKTVMIIGHPLNPQRYILGPGIFSLFQLELKLRIVDLLKKEGYRIIYKMHPEQKQEAEGIFDGLVDSILTEPFETVYKEADAYFFGHISTTTFSFALCTNKPIFVIDIKGMNWNLEAYELLCRRCIMIPAYFDEKNRIQFDEALLLKKLAQKPERPDFAYVEKFMFPSPGQSPFSL